MLSKNNSIQRDQLEIVALDELVPQDHLVRKMEAMLFARTFDTVLCDFLPLRVALSK